MYRLAHTLDRIIARIERAKVLDPIADAVTRVVRRLVPSGAVRDAAAGTPTGHPMHPPLTALTIGSLSAATLLGVTGADPRSTRRVMGMGLLVAVPTVYAGLGDWSHTAAAERRVGLIHATVNDLAVGCYLAGSLRSRDPQGRSGRILPVAGWLLMAVGGMLGGHLSYGMGVGVDTTAFEHLELEWTDVAAEADVPEQGLVGAHADGIPVLLSRVEDTVVALADRCTHRGGPLHDGAVCDGAVQCPWHGSRFRLTDGTVQAGPAVRPQPALQVHVVHGRVQVRRSELRALRTRPAV
jgi:nitrite reductase/ring-hydroxylating ferredoxin subunit/uncharacterized membrane protein